MRGIHLAGPEAAVSQLARGVVPTGATEVQQNDWSIQTLLGRVYRVQGFLHLGKYCDAVWALVSEILFWRLPRGRGRRCKRPYVRHLHTFRILRHGAAWHHSLRAKRAHRARNDAPWWRVISVRIDSSPIFKPIRLRKDLLEEVYSSRVTHKKIIRIIWNSVIVPWVSKSSPTSSKCWFADRSLRQNSYLMGHAIK